MRRERQSGVPSDRGSSCDIYWRLEIDDGYIVGLPGTYMKSSLPVMAHSSQLKANALALETVRVMAINLRVSRAPQRRSR